MGMEFLNKKNIDEGLQLARKSHAESAWQDYPFDETYLRKNLEKMIENPQFFTYIYRKNGKMIGYFFATLGRFLFSDILLGMENGIYIEPEHRGGKIAFLMYSEFLAWCKKMKAEPLIEIYFGNDADNLKTYDFFRKVGMMECGKIFRGGAQWDA